ncbi:DUF6979 family protein [Vibrio quintilis]|uniref:Uncharacterized protein n=1 Tax=Vibrio quintilis TaxID=1117707 RepID=A0A1M7YW95_9VIBR|nr:hypothetical protein [Vibrio quintilis]SHO56980.1 hypothetical protein VQ7734_02749 [Vibrio quintilis]
MNKYGKVAVQAVKTAQTGIHPVKAWKQAAAYEFGECKASAEKGCPKSSFLGLAEEGLIQDIPGGNYTKSEINKRYALELLRLLKQEPELVHHKSVLWKKACGSDTKRHNGQRDVVIGLWCEGLLN